MNVQEWEIVIGVITASALAVGPWTFMVHAKLAVLSSQVTRLEQKVDQVVDSEFERLPRCIQHDAALKEIERRLETIEERMKDEG